MDITIAITPHVLELFTGTIMALGLYATCAYALKKILTKGEE